MKKKLKRKDKTIGVSWIFFIFKGYLIDPHFGNDDWLIK
jgi:hypothetical protein